MFAYGKRELYGGTPDETNITKGGHLVKSIISATGEIVITKLEGEVQRELNPDIGLNLFKFI